MANYNYWNTTTPASADIVWRAWTCDATTSTAGDTVWQSWTSTGTTSTTSGDSIWQSWTYHGAAKPKIIETPPLVWKGRRPVPPKSPRPAPVRRPGRVDKPLPLIEDKAKIIIEDKAEIKAGELLLDLIGEDEFKIYKETGRLFVKGRRFDYIIQRDRIIGGIQRIEKDKITDLCAHIARSKGCPKTDNVIALKLALETNEWRTLRLANEHGSKDRIDGRLPLAACMRLD